MLMLREQAVKIPFLLIFEVSHISNGSKGNLGEQILLGN